MFKLSARLVIFVLGSGFTVLSLLCMILLVGASIPVLGLCSFSRRLTPQARQSRLETRRQQQESAIVVAGIRQRARISIRTDRRNLHALCRLTLQEIKCRRTNMNHSVFVETLRILYRARSNVDFREMMLLHNAVTGSPPDRLNDSLSRLTQKVPLAP